MNVQEQSNTRKLARQMRLISVGTQAGIFDTRLISGFLLDLLQKLHEVHQTFQCCSDDLEKGRANLDDTEQTMSTMQTTLGNFSNTVDSLGVHLLQENASLTHNHLALEKVRKDVAAKRAHIAEISRKLGCPKELRKREQRLYDLKEERAKLELQLAKVNSDIDATYEDLYTIEERLYGVKDLRDKRRTEQTAIMESLKQKCDNSAARKSQILSLMDAGTIPDMRDVYVSPEQFKRLQADIETLKYKQTQVDRHIQMQFEEREFLRTTAKEICQKVYDLELKVRKETGDHGFKSRQVDEPKWYQDMGNPTVWFTPPKLTQDQLQMLIERQSKEYRFAHAQTETETPTTSANNDEENILAVELLGETLL